MDGVVASVHSIKIQYQNDCRFPCFEFVKLTELAVSSVMEGWARLGEMVRFLHWVGTNETERQSRPSESEPK